MRLVIRLLFVFTILSFAAQSQKRLPIGAWQVHLPNNSCNSVARLGSKIYAGGVGSFISYDTQTGTAQTLSEIDGFTQTTVTRLGVSENTNTLVIAYDNGQVDLLNNGVISLVNDIFISNISGSKAINHLYFINNEVILSTDFGVLVYDISKRQTREVYLSFDSLDGYKKVYSTAILGDTIFVSTSNGVFKASNKDEVNRLDYRNWALIPVLTTDQSPPFEHMASYNGELFLSKGNLYFTYFQGVYTAGGNTIINDAMYNSSVSYGLFLGFAYVNNNLVFLRENNAFVYNGNQCARKYLSNINQPIDIIQDTKEIFWVASADLGLLSNPDGSNTFVSFGKNGPGFVNAFSISRNENKIIAVPGGFDDTYTGNIITGNFSVYENGVWSNYNSSMGNIPNTFDLVSSSHNSFNKKTYFSSWANGLIEWDGGSTNSSYRILNDTTPGVPLQNCNVGDFCLVPGALYCRIADVQVDSKGTIWIANPTSENKGNPSLFSRTLDGTWQAYNWISGSDRWNSYNYTANFANTNSAPYYITKILIDKYDNKWMLSRFKSSKQGGMIVFNESKYYLPRYLQYQTNVKQDICGNHVSCIVEDNDGAIWIGTDNGICYFSDPNQVFQQYSISAAVPVFDNRALLKGQNVSALEVDASNRKWVGTSESGIWLFNNDGSKQIFHFDVNNSPLPSNNIVDIKVLNNTGEVFISTTKGMVSYGGNSVEGTDENGSVIVYPNPVKREFTGYLAISGLANSANVKITDISGQLVFQTKAEGSLASWNLKDYNGRRPQPGIYLVFTSKDDGSEALVNKIAILD